MSTKTKLNLIYCNHMFHSHSILNPTFQPVLCVCRFGVIFTYVIEGIDSKAISVCLINDYLLISDLHIFDYGRAGCASISFK